MANEKHPNDLWLFFGLACVITWVLDAPAAILSLTGGDPSPTLPLAGIGAFGPTIAAYICARRRGAVGDVFRRWRPSHIGWLLVAPFIPLAVHTVANVVHVALGGTIEAWFFPPVSAEHVLGLIFFSIGEEFGWRGFAQPRAGDRFGPVLGSIVIGVVWGLWHWVMFLVQGFGPQAFARGVFELAFFAIIFGFCFERSGRSMAVAIALHAGAHLDNPDRASAVDEQLIAIRMAVTIACSLAVAAYWRRLGRRAS